MKKSIKIYETVDNKERFVAFTEVHYESYKGLQIFANQLRQDNIRLEFDVSNGENNIGFNL